MINCISNSLRLNSHTLSNFLSVCTGKRGNACVCECVRMKKQIPCGAAHTAPTITVPLTGDYELGFVKLHRRSQGHTGAAASQTQLSSAWTQFLHCPQPFVLMLAAGSCRPKPASQESLIFELFTPVLQRSVNWLGVRLTTRQKKHREQTVSAPLILSLLLWKAQAL